ncbi:MAG: hypothetical protein WD063_13455 [Pirellulales bacterium]
MTGISRFGLACLLCLLAVAETGVAQEGAVPAKIEKFLKLCETSKRGAILNLEHELRGLRRQAPQTREASRHIANLEEQLRVLRSNERPVVPPIAFPPQVGAIGRLPRLSCHVDQVVSDDALLVRGFFPVVVTTVHRFQAQRETVVQPVRFLVRGLPTRNVDEGSDLEMLDVFEVTGQETHRSADGGSDSVLVLKPFDMKSVEPYFRKMAGQDR